MIPSISYQKTLIFIERVSACNQSNEYHGDFDWLHPKILSMKSSYYGRKRRESLETGMTVVRYGQDKFLNRDNGNVIKTNAWKTLFKKIKILRRNFTIK